MNIPQSAIQPFEPHGLPKLNFIKNLESTTLEIILDIMDALDNFMKDNAENCFMFAHIIEVTQAQALADHMCGWLEETAMRAGADIVKAQARAIFTISEEIDETGVHKEFLSPSINSKSRLIGFMYLVDFTVNDEDINHLMDYKFKRDPQ